MERVDLGTILQGAIARFHQNRIGPKPRVFAMISGSLPKVAWHDRSLNEFTRLFLYECLLSNHPDSTVEIAVRRKIELKDLNRFIGIQPTYWVQLRVSSPCALGQTLLQNGRQSTPACLRHGNLFLANMNTRSRQRLAFLLSPATKCSPSNSFLPCGWQDAGPIVENRLL